jgi:PadR family transcriptional regulator PadR
MPARPDSSPQTRAVLGAMHNHPAHWRYGYDISRETGLASGTLYPILGEPEAARATRRRPAEEGA